MSLIRRHQTVLGSVSQSLATSIGMVVFGVLGILIAFLTSRYGPTAPIAVIAALLGVLFVIICFKSPELAFYTTIIVSSLFALPGRLMSTYFPWGLVIEVMQYLTFLGILARQFHLRTDTRAFWRHPAMILVLIQYLFMLVEVLNPSMLSLLGWSVLVRKAGSYILFIYMAYHVLTSISKVMAFFKMWLIISLLIALYGIKQQWFGFFGFEERWIMSDPRGYALLFQGGFIRKMSILNDPPLFGIGMAIMAAISLIFGFRVENRTKRIILFILTFIFLVASSYSGTRTANVVFAANIAAYFVFTLGERRTFMFAAATVFALGFLLFGPFKNNQVVWRVRTTFEGTKEASAVVRDVNRHAVQPYVWQHPIGGGIGSSGYEGALYSPSHYLSTYQPDGFLPKMLVEEGPVGMFIHLVLMFVFLVYAINGYHKARKPEIKTLFTIIASFYFACAVGEVSQNVPGSYPYVYLYFTFIGLMIKLPELDAAEPETNINT